ncbi:MAG: CotH kinase family protein [Planctomycetota bacterium]|nr:CotH kinase family protein [Planctomycetota bacterium]
MKRALRGMKLICRVLWAYSLFVTLPLAVLVLFWVTRVGVSFHDFGIRYGRSVGNPDLYSSGVYEVRRLKNLARIALSEEGVEQETELRQVHLMVGLGSERALNSRLPISGREYKKGYLLYPDGQLGDVKVRYRGDFAWHWASDKKSWRVKTPKGALWGNMRAFNLVIPKGIAMVEDTLGYWLAREMGLLAPDTDLAELVINGKSRGVYTLVEQLEELVLRKNGRMPGDLYAGELIGRDAHYGMLNLIFENPGLWEKTAVNNHFDLLANDPLARLCELLKQPPSQANSQELAGLVDIDAFGRFAAYRVLTQSKHFDQSHNWRLFYDPWKCRFEPVVWDTVPWHKDWMPAEGAEPFREPMYSTLDDRLALNPQYRIALDRSLNSFFTSGLRDRTLAKYEELCRKSEQAVRRDPVLSYTLSTIYEPQHVFDYRVDARNRIASLFDFLESRHVSEPPLMGLSRLDLEGSAQGWRLAMFGRRSVEGVRLEFESELVGPIETEISYSTPNGIHRVNTSSSTTVHGRSVDIEVPLIGGMKYKANPNSRSFADRGVMENVTVSFDVVVRSAGQTLKGIRCLPLLAGGKPVSLTLTDNLPNFAHGAEALAVAGQTNVEVIEWEGDIHLTQDLYIAQPLLIRAGTTVRMDPGVSVLVEAPVLARGTQERPIQIIPTEAEGDPWGTFAIRDSLADGSMFEWVHFEGGSGKKEPLAEFSAMLSIHWVQGVQIRNCSFKDSKIVDDMVHGVYSEVTFDGCHFENSLADALDMDISRLWMKDCTFLESGNDSVDLMTTVAVVEGTHFLRSFDKAISIGENSTLFARNCIFDSCEIALQSKDDSQAAIVNSDIVRCVWGVDAYKKNWRYHNGGEIFLYKSRLYGNSETLRADKHSRVGISDCQTDSMELVGKGILDIGPGMNTSANEVSNLPRGVSYRFPREKQLLHAIGQNPWRSVQLNQRGSDHAEK